MARTYSGGSATDRVNATISAPAGAFSVGAWLNMSTWATGRTFAGAGTSDALFSGLLTGAATAQRLRLKLNCATTDMVVEVAAPATGAWFCAVAVYTNSLTATANLIYTGNLTTAMSSQAHVTDTNGSGAVSFGTDGTIGKNSAATTAIAGAIAQPFLVPWAMTAAEVEAFRQGNWTTLFRGGRPTFFLPFRMGETAAYDLGGTGSAWTITSTPDVSVDPPISYGFKPAAVVVQTRLPVTTPLTPSGGITPAGTVGKVISKSLAGGLT